MSVANESEVIESSSKNWHVYILLCRDGKYYVGVTGNLARRCGEHFNGAGGHYTKSDPPRELVHAEAFCSQQQAERRERQIKGWTRAGRRRR